ncbi:MAG: NDP-sugar synthase [Chloroflexi bacterium]|nr:NDP-sugar synthase [Chloroflexota bacterium]
MEAAVGAPKAVILVGGEGTRLRPLTLGTHKSMVPVLNRPFLEHLLEHLKEHGIQEVVLALRHLHHQLLDYFGDGSAFGIALHYVVEDSPLGTAGAVKNAGHFLDDTCFVINGDIYTDLDLTAMLEFHRQRGAMATIALTHVEDVSSYGVVEIGVGSRVRRFLEKPHPSQTSAQTINAGTYILEPQVLDLVPPGQPYMFETGLFPALLSAGWPLFGHPSSCYWIDIGTPQRYLSLNHHLLHLRQSAAGHSQSHSIWSDDGCYVHPTAQVVGPILMGEGCRIGAGARVEGPSILGVGCSVEPGARVVGSILWAQARVEAGAVVEKSVLARGCCVGSRAHTTSGCVLGDETSVPPGSRLEPGTLVWPETPPEKLS